MNASRTQANRRVDFSGGIPMQGAIVDFLRRRDSSSLRQIQRHFSGTPAEHIAAQVSAAFDAGVITIKRNGLGRSAGYVYEVTETVLSNQQRAW